MGYCNKVQMINRRNSQQFYVTLPSAIAQSMGFRKGECVEWEIMDAKTLLLKKRNADNEGEDKD
jgi:hypothetical protein